EGLQGLIKGNITVPTRGKSPELPHFLPGAFYFEGSVSAQGESAARLKYKIEYTWRTEPDMNGAELNMKQLTSLVEVPLGKSVTIPWKNGPDEISHWLKVKISKVSFDAVY